MKLVILESPYAGNVEANILYAREAVRDSLQRGEAPIASHLLYTQPGILDDNVPAERQWGIDAGLAWRKVAEGTVAYLDNGMSNGMRYGIKAALEAGKDVQIRLLYPEPRDWKLICAGMEWEAGVNEWMESLQCTTSSHS